MVRRKVNNEILANKETIMEKPSVNIESTMIPSVRLIPALADLYRRHRPEMSERFANRWKGVVEEMFGEAAAVSIAPVVHLESEFREAVARAERDDVECLCVLLMAYTPSGELIEPLVETKLPLLILSTAWDATLPENMDAEHLLRDQAAHGVMDLTNALRRRHRPFAVVAGHPDIGDFNERVREAVRAAAGARISRTARIGQVGTFFPGMLDFTYDSKNQREHMGFEVAPVAADALVESARAISKSELDAESEWIADRCVAEESLTAAELEAGARISAALRATVLSERLDGVGLSFISLLEAGAESLPFMGAARLMAEGIGYAGEGDVLTAVLQAILRRACGESGFTEWFCPDYERGEILLSHMGECNMALARGDEPIRLRPRPFAWGSCQRVPVPVFQLRPGRVTIASLSESPPPDGQTGFQLVTTVGDVVDGPVFPNLVVPHSRIRLDGSLEAFIEAYSYAGGGHHAALVYGDQRRALQMIGRFTGINVREVTG